MAFLLDQVLTDLGSLRPWDQWEAIRLTTEGELEKGPNELRAWIDVALKVVDQIQSRREIPLSWLRCALDGGSTLPLQLTNECRLSTGPDRDQLKIDKKDFPKLVALLNHDDLRNMRLLELHHPYGAEIELLSDEVLQRLNGLSIQVEGDGGNLFRRIIRLVPARASVVFASTGVTNHEDWSNRDAGEFSGLSCTVSTRAAEELLKMGAAKALSLYLLPDGGALSLPLSSSMPMARRVESLRIGASIPQINKTDFSRLTRLRELELHSEFSELSPQCLPCEAPTAPSLRLERCKVDATVLATLVQTELVRKAESLSLPLNPLGSAGGMILARAELPLLKELELMSTKIGLRAARAILKRPGLRRLQLRETDLSQNKSGREKTIAGVHKLAADHGVLLNLEN